jgi:Icc-related predicted phosphoesterase
MKVLPVSDLHLEFGVPVNYVEWPDADVLLLCGDIGVGEPVRDFIREVVACGKWEYVFSLMGNHEGYNKLWEEEERLFRELHKELELEGYKFLANGDSYPIFDGKYLVIGGTLWSDLCTDITHRVMAEYYMNDYSMIRSLCVPDQFMKNAVSVGDALKAIEQFDPENGETWQQGSPACRSYTFNGINVKPRTITATLTTAWHRHMVSVLEDKISIAKAAHPDVKIIVATHHTPHTACLSTRHAGSELDRAYYTDLQYLFKDVDLWACGHTHNRLVTEIDGCKLVMNCRGYHSKHQMEIHEKFVPVAVEV